MDVNDTEGWQEIIKDIPDSCHLPKRKGGYIAKEIITPIETANFIMGLAHWHDAFVCTKTIADMTEELPAP